MNDPISIKGLPWLLKIMAAVIGAIFALTLSGKSRAIKELQQAVGVPDDGIIGPKTIAAVNAKEVNDVLLMLASERLSFYTSLKTWATYGKGWTNRVAENLKYAAQDN